MMNGSNADFFNDLRYRQIHSSESYIADLLHDPEIRQRMKNDATRGNCEITVAPLDSTMCERLTLYLKNSQYFYVRKSSSFCVLRYKIPECIERK